MAFLLHFFFTDETFFKKLVDLCFFTKTKLNKSMPQLLKFKRKHKGFLKPSC